MNTTITLAGNLTRDPALRFTTGGTPVAEVSVAVNRRVKDGTEWKDAPPTFHDVKIWGNAAEHVVDSLGRGARVLVHGTVETETWDKDGEQRSRDVVVVSERSGEIATSLRYAAATPEKTSRPTAAEQGS